MSNPPVNPPVNPKKASNNLHQAGVRFLKQIARHSDVIMDTYLSGTIADHEADPAVLNKLIKHRILYRPEPEADLRLRSKVRGLLEEVLRDEHNRQIDANVSSVLAAFSTLSAHYKEARHNMDYAAAEAYLSDLSEHVYAFNEDLRHNIRVLWSRINNEFGYVKTINAKIRENELAQSQVTDLLNGLQLMDFSQLADVAGDIRELRRMLVMTLQKTQSECAHELRSVQSRLLELLGRFREIRGRTRLLKGWLLYMDQHPDFQSSDPVQFKQTPVLFNVAEAILTTAAIDIKNQQHELDYFDIIGRLKANDITQQHKLNLLDAPDLILKETADFHLPDNLVKDSVDDYFCYIIDTGKRLSALEYYQQNGFTWDKEEWLYQIIAGYEGLPEEQKQFFGLEYQGYTHRIYSGNYYIQDINLWLA